MKMHLTKDLDEKSSKLYMMRKYSKKSLSAANIFIWYRKSTNYCLKKLASFAQHICNTAKIMPIAFIIEEQ